MSGYSQAAARPDKTGWVTEIVEECLRRARERADLNAFITLLPEAARRQAQAVEEALAAGKSQPLAGVVLAVKDNIALQNVPLTCGSKILEGYVSPYTATALQRLIDAGAVVVGKTNLDEFAMGSSGEYSAFGPTLNPLDTERVPGGSSSGSAAAVAAGMATAALGSDTGGSVRQPAAFCGLVGLKPTYGRVSRYGLTAFASSLDQIGVLAQNVAEVARIYQVMAGPDPRDNTTSPVPVQPCPAHLPDWGSVRIGVVQGVDSTGIQAEIRAALDKCIGILQSLGVVVRECHLPHLRFAIPAYYVIAPAEASSNLARYDGVRYGWRAPAEPSAEGAEANLVQRSRQGGFGPEVRRRILLGTYVLSAGYYEAFYRKAQQVRRLIREDFLRAFGAYDLLLSPTTSSTAFRLGERASDPLQMYLSDLFTVGANLAGLPAVSFPFGRDERGLPIGLQFIAPDFCEDLALTIAQILERNGAGRD